jgi:hypothetical protein
MAERFKLFEEILALSESQDWDIARMEWELTDITIEYNETCLCGHSPISELCHIRNTENGNRTFVGNHCVNKFREDLEMGAIFSAVKKVKKDKTASFSSAAIEYFRERGWLNDWEYGFYTDIYRKRSRMSEKQWTHKEKINKKILLKIYRS